MKTTLTDNNIFSLRFFGDDITPESFSLKELANIISSFEDGINSIIDEKFPHIESEDINISLIEIENKSESLKFKMSNLPEVSQAVYLYGNSVNDNSYINLPDKAYNSLKIIHSAINKKSCRVELKHNEAVIFQISFDKELIKPESALIKSDGIVYGELVKIGGDKAQAWIKTDNENTIKFSLTKEQAKQFQGNLYSPIAIKGEKVTNINTDILVKFKLYEILNYKPFTSFDAIKKLQSITSGFWDTLNSNEEINTFLSR